mmetsp:Transcript_52615/g.60465  ORF Transcript_52615/g.60465 Transcript_52615/m.60465 type:complete len:252 (-) Transcript_52615:36-791(-)
MEEQSSQSILVIRHAQSIHNLARKNATKETEFAVQFDKQYKDTELSEIGIKQCEEALEKAHKQNIGLVFTSPLRRAMETSRRLFGDHPNKPKIEVLPEIREVFTDSGDVPLPWTGELEKRFSEFDFSRLERFKEKKPLWFVELCEENVKKMLYELFEKKDPDTIPSDIIIDEMIKVAPEYIETQIPVMERVLAVRKMIKERASQLKEGEKVVVVAHGHLIYYLIAESFDAEGNPKKTKYLSNCEFFEYKLE